MAVVLHPDEGVEVHYSHEDTSSFEDLESRLRAMVTAAHDLHLRVTNSRVEDM